MWVAGLCYRDGVHSLEVMLESLSGGRRREIQSYGGDFYLSVIFLFKYLRLAKPSNDINNNQCQNLQI